MTSFVLFLDGLYDRLHFQVLRIISFVLAIICAGALIWDPFIFAEKIGGFTVFNATGIIWATCSSLIYGIGFKPRFWLWQIAFFPPLAWLIFLVVFISVLY